MEQDNSGIREAKIALKLLGCAVVKALLQM
jgi:hypothetical protein